MKKNKEKSIRYNLLKSIAIIFLLIIPFGICLIWIGYSYAEKQDEKQRQTRFNSLDSIVNDISAERTTAVQSFDKELEKHISIMTTSLAELITEEGYTGKYVFSDGFIAELDGDRVILPAGIPGGEYDISREMIDSSLSSGKMRTGHLMTKPAGNDYNDYLNASYYLSFGRISNHLVYVDLTSEAEFTEYQELYLSDNYDAMQAAAELYDSVSLIVRVNGDQTELLSYYGNLGENLTLTDLGITGETIQNKEPEVDFKGVRYECNYMEQDNTGADGVSVYVIQMLPIMSEMGTNVIGTIIVCSIILIINTTAVLYVLLLCRLAKRKPLMKEQAERYRPSSMNTILLNAGIVGTIIVFLSAYAIQGIIHFKSEVEYGTSILNVLADHYNNQVVVQNDKVMQEMSEWDLYQMEYIAELVDEYPELTAPQMLWKYSQTLNADYIMQFDGQGNEICSSNGYVGFTLDEGPVEGFGDFRRLTQGIPSIIQEAAADTIAGINRRMVGVRLPNTDESGRYGALIMAMDPYERKDADVLKNLSEEFSLLMSEGKLCFVADSESGEILFSGVPSTVGMTITECGLSENSLQDGYLDYGSVKDGYKFIFTKRQDDKVYFYSPENSRVSQNEALFSLIAAAAFLFTYILIIAWAKKGYTETAFQEFAVIYSSEEELLSKKKTEEQPKAKETGSADVQIRKTFKAALKDLFEKIFHFREMPPSGKVLFVFNCGVLASIIVIRLLIHVLMPTASIGSLFSFLLHGNWARGANLFAFCSIALISGIIYIVNVAGGKIFDILVSILPAKWQTLCMLVKSVIRYFSIFYGIYLGLGYLGFPIETIVASLGVVSLSLSLGARDLAADIIAGLFFLIEKSFKVGDIVEINGTRGKIVEMGIRTTKFIVTENNIQTISNHNISTIVNLTEKLSEYTLSLKISGKENLESLEELLRKELPKIKEKCDLIVGDIVYMGVYEVGGGRGLYGYIINISAGCLENNMKEVKYFLNREIYLLFEREGIGIM